MLAETQEGGQAGGADWTEAPAVELVATRCVACGRALLDAQSLATAMGPICRELYGRTDLLTDEQRATANRTIYRLALADHGGADAPALIGVLASVGLTELVQRIEQRLVKVRAEYRAERRLLLVQTPKTARWSAVAPKLGVVTEEGLTVATNAKALRLAYAAISAYFPGLLMRGPRGLVIVPAAVQS